MKITHFTYTETSVSQKGNWIFVTVHTDEGVSGIGEASQSGNDALVILALKHFETVVKGQDPTNINKLWYEMVYPKTVFSGDMGRVGATAISAIDQALWDIKGKAYGQPVWKLLGGKHRDRIRLYANLNRGIFDRSPNGFKNAAKEAVNAGFTAVKCTPFDEVSYLKADRHGFDQGMSLGVKRLREVRQVIGPDIDLLVDFHGRFNYNQACKLRALLDDLNLFWIEEPIPEGQVETMADFHRTSSVPIAGGETLFGCQNFWDIIEKRAVQILMPDVKHAGGISECLKIAAMAEVKQIAISPHSPAGPVSNMAGVHLAAAIPNFLVLEYAFGEVEWRLDSCSPAEVIEQGYMRLPNQPGLGIELNSKLSHHCAIH